MEDRIIELETKVAYQDHLLEELNELVIEQQKQIDKLGKQLKKFIEQSDAENEPDVVDVKPPHY